MSKSQQALEALVCGYGRKHREAKVLVMLKAYFDDSTSDEGDKNLVLAGCVQRYNTWANFSIAWEAALARDPSIRWFHMREARTLSGEFRGWKGSVRDAKIRYLATVAAEFQPWTIAAWMSRKEHDAILKPIAPFMLRHPYLTLFYAVILKLARFHRDGGITFPVDFVFDEQGPMGTEAAIWYECVKAWQPDEVKGLLGGSPKFEDDKLILPLQAADMLAWHIRRRKDRPHEDASKWATAPIVGLVHAEIQLTKEFLLDTVEQMKQVRGLDKVQSKSKDHRDFKRTLEQVIGLKFPKK